MPQLPHTWIGRSRWFICVTVIVIVGLVAFVPLPTAPARAADATVAYRYYMDVVNPRTSICIGETVHYTVIVNRTPVAGDLAPKPVAGVKVEAYIDDPNLGSFSNTRKGGSSFQQTGFNLDPVDSVEFQFTAGKKPGKTTLQFQGIVAGVEAATGYVSFPVGIEIKICNYRITTVTRFPPNGRGNPGHHLSADRHQHEAGAGQGGRRRELRRHGNIDLDRLEVPIRVPGSSGVR